jgi:hypothetical protein
MKKLSAMLVAFILVAATAFTAFAAGINDRLFSTNSRHLLR